MNSMNLSETISINNVDSKQDQSAENSKLYDTVSNESKDNLPDCNRITYTREQLINVFKLNYSNVCPDWIKNNQNFPRRLEIQSSQEYINKLIKYDFVAELNAWSNREWFHSKFCPKRNNKNENVNNKQKKELGSNEEEEKNEQIESINNPNARLNLQIGQQDNKNEFFKNSYNNGNYNNYSNNFKGNNINNKFNDKSQIFGNRNNENHRTEDRNDSRGFLRSRGENLNQNFASNRRFLNRNQNSSNSNNTRYHHNHQQDEPEWYTDTITQHDTIELKGFDEDEDKNHSNKNSNVQKQQPDKNQHHVNSLPPQQYINNNEKQKADFDLIELTNFDWQSVDANTHQNSHQNSHQNAKSVDFQANSSRFARWFNKPALVNSTTENKIEKLFSNARNSNNNAINNSLFNQQQEQQTNLQNNFFDNLINRSNGAQNQNVDLHHQPIKQLNAYRNQQAEGAEFMNTASKKTDQQLLNILQKARINVDSLMIQHNVLNKNNVIKGQIKSAEELEASLFNNAENNNTHPRTNAINEQQIQNQQVNSVDLFQKLCLNNNNEITTDQPTDNYTINPFVLNLLDNAQNKKQKNININTTPNTSYNKNKIIYPQNMMFLNNQEKKVDPFMPTCVIRKFAKEKNNLINNKGSENFNLNIENQSNFNLNQNNLMQQNFAITTGNRWNENNIQFHRVDSTTTDNNQTKNEDTKSMNTETLTNILIKASKRQVDPNAFLNSFARKPQSINNNQFPKVQNDNQKKLIEILQKASTNYNKTDGNKINNWFELELKKNNDHLSPIIKENAFTLEDVERT